MKEQKNMERDLTPTPHQTTPNVKMTPRLWVHPLLWKGRRRYVD